MPAVECCCTAHHSVSQFKFCSNTTLDSRIKAAIPSALVTHTTGRAVSMGYFQTQSCCVCLALHC